MIFTKWVHLIFNLIFAFEIFMWCVVFEVIHINPCDSCEISLQNNRDGHGAIIHPGDTFFHVTVINMLKDYKDE